MYLIIKHLSIKVTILSTVRTIFNTVYNIQHLKISDVRFRLKYRLYLNISKKIIINKRIITIKILNKMSFY